MIAPASGRGQPRGVLVVYAMVNGGRVSGLLPVVGVPMPLLGYGGTSAVTLLAGFGIVMSVYGSAGSWCEEARLRAIGSRVRIGALSRWR